MNVYKWLYSRIGGRPWTYIWRDLWHQAEYLMQALWFFGGIAVGIYFGWKVAGIAWAIYTFGYINGHFFWADKYIKGQKVGDSVSLSYLAGVFDGEGSIIIKVKHYPRNLSHTVQAQMGCNSKEAILWFYNRFGGCIWNDKTKPSRANFNQWHWEVTGDKCSYCLKAMYPFLRIKKHEAKVAIDFQDNKDSMSLPEREVERHYLHGLKGNKRVLKDYGIKMGTKWVKGQKG